MSYKKYLVEGKTLSRYARDRLRSRFRDDDISDEIEDTGSEAEDSSNKSSDGCQKKIGLGSYDTNVLRCDSECETSDDELLDEGCDEFDFETFDDDDDEVLITNI